MKYKTYKISFSRENKQHTKILGKWEKNWRRKWKKTRH